MAVQNRDCLGDAELTELLNICESKIKGQSGNTLINGRDSDLQAPGAFSDFVPMLEPEFDTVAVPLVPQMPNILEDETAVEKELFPPLIDTVPASCEEKDYLYTPPDSPVNTSSHQDELLRLQCWQQPQSVCEQLDCTSTDQRSACTAQQLLLNCIQMGMPTLSGNLKLLHDRILMQCQQQQQLCGSIIPTTKDPLDARLPFNVGASSAVIPPEHCRGRGEGGWDETLLEISTVQLNRYLKTANLTPSEVCALKTTRRRIKNRGYTQKSRAKRTTPK